MGNQVRDDLKKSGTLVRVVMKVDLEDKIPQS